jgi:hypothetical protein
MENLSSTELEMAQSTLPALPASEECDPDAWLDDGFPIEGASSIEGDGSIAVTEVDASMQIMEDGDYPEDEEFEEGVL